jgi:lysine/ornithine N-monooxygenase
MTPMDLDLAASTLIVKQDTDVPWQRVMLLRWAQNQVSFLKGLVTGSAASSTSCAIAVQQRTALYRRRPR